MSTITLNDGVEIPQLGFGVFQTPPDETARACLLALEAGYRHIDTAAAYRNEAGVGAAIAASGLPRDEIFVTTKLRNADQGHGSAAAAFELSRDTLGVEVIDLYLIHWPVPSQDLYSETYAALIPFVESGAIRSLGVSNFLPEHIDRIVADTGRVPSVDQVEAHPLSWRTAVQDYCVDTGIALESYSPLGQGRDLDEPVVRQLSATYNKSPAQIVLRWHIEHGRIVIPKSVTPERITQNAQIFDFRLAADEVEAIDALNSPSGAIGPDPATFDWPQTSDRPRN